MIKYLGSKRLLIDWILEVIRKKVPHATSALDIFSGTSRVSYALKKEGYRVISNDHNLYAYHLAHCYVETDKEELPQNLGKIIDHLNKLKGKHGFFTENYSIKSQFFHPKNGEKIDAIREEIEQLDLDKKTRSVLLVSLMEAADRVDSTCGIQMAYLKSWAPRAHNPLLLKMPDILHQAKHGKSKALCIDACDAAKYSACDVAYLDPPYNQHSYRSNYHIWETLVRYDKPELYGKAHKRLDCRTQKSPFNSKRNFYASLYNVINNLRCKHIILSFNDEGFVNKEELEGLLSEFGKVEIFNKNYRRYVGAQIGIFNQSGKKVGKINKLFNKEFLYFVSLS